MMKGNIKKIIYFIETPFDERDYERCGVYTLIENGFEVQIWDFTPFLNAYVYENDKDRRQKNNEFHRLFFSKKEALFEILNLDNSCFVVCFITFAIGSFSIFKMLSKKEIKYCVFRANIIPLPSRKTRLFSLSYIKSGKLYISKIMNLFFSDFAITKIGLKPATLLLAGGQRSVSYNYPITKDIEILWLHSLDYDIYLRKRDEVKENPHVGVFLDEYLPFHSDYIYFKVKPFATSEEYYPLICRFFDNVERTNNVKIVVAAHPRSNYEKHGDLFDGRMVVKNKTFELLRESRFVIAHSSTAIDFAVLLKKPIIFITTNRLKKTREGPIIDAMATILGKKPINIDEQFNIDLNKELIVNEKLYDQYRNDYIKKKNSEENYFWQIVANRLRQFH